ncbi:hypothetical protein DNI29_17745 [Hymenobacter sediminis]|uniref:hypothetical protein n=1 Tax=Hymenobacter sediminis TaxID=2218621 RepID=UPI000DA665BC|nr:hypothetical protein [Hymenobacter sediminis]RPD45236.1 hypothetical protein DNI29_17745 [Hymenobacter sediminis]
MAALLSSSALGLSACQPDQPTSTTTRQQPSTTSVAENSTARATADTLHVADSLGHRAGILQLRASTEANFARLPAGPLPTRPSDQENQSNVPDAPLPADGRVQRQGELLVLRPTQGPTVTLTPVPSPDGPEGNDNAYYYWGSLPQAHQWVIDVATDEGPAVLLVDQRTGRRTSLLGAPSISPDGRYLLSVCEDVTSGGTPTNLSLYRCDSAAPQLVWSRDLSAWGPRAARWRDARHVVLQQAHADPDPNSDVAEAASRVRLTYAELELPTQHN